LLFAVEYFNIYITYRFEYFNIYITYRSLTFRRLRNEKGKNNQFFLCYSAVWDSGNYTLAGALSGTVPIKTKLPERGEFFI